MYRTAGGTQTTSSGNTHQEADRLLVHSLWYAPPAIDHLCGSYRRASRWWSGFHVTGQSYCRICSRLAQQADGPGSSGAQRSPTPHRTSCNSPTHPGSLHPLAGTWGAGWRTNRVPSRLSCAEGGAADAAPPPPAPVAQGPTDRGAAGKRLRNQEAARLVTRPPAATPPPVAASAGGASGAGGVVAAVAPPPVAPSPPPPTRPHRGGCL